MRVFEYCRGGSSSSASPNKAPRHVVLGVVLALAAALSTLPAQATDTNQETYWEDAYGVECVKYEPHSGWIPKHYDLVVVKGGPGFPNVYEDFGPGRVYAPTNPNTGRPYGISWVMKCSSTSTTSTTTSTSTSSTTTSTTSTTAPTTTSSTQAPTTSTLPTTTTSTVGSTTSTPGPTTSSLPPVTTTSPAEPPAELPLTGGEWFLYGAFGFSLILLGAWTLKEGRR